MNDNDSRISISPPPNYVAHDIHQGYSCDNGHIAWLHNTHCLLVREIRITSGYSPDGFTRNGTSEIIIRVLLGRITLKQPGLEDIPVEMGSVIFIKPRAEYSFYSITEIAELFLVATHAGDVLGYQDPVT